MTRRLQALSVGNFKAFAETQRIPLKPITLIFGPNSSGKSSFIHSLALAHEAQFGGEKRSTSRFDIHHTDIGGSSIDLGGFRQYVHRGQLNKRVEWGVEVKVSSLKEEKRQLLAPLGTVDRLSELLSPAQTVSLSLSLGIELDDQDRPRPGADPHVDSIEIFVDGDELLRMSRRPTVDKDRSVHSSMRVDRLSSEHQVFKQILKAIVEATTTSETMRPEDIDAANDAIAELLPELEIPVEKFFPSGIVLPTKDGAKAHQSMLFAVSKGNRKEDIAQAIRFVLPLNLNELITGLAEVLSDELKNLQYLGPLRSFPPRHLAFAEHEDSNWYAGGGYAWDVVRRDEEVREAVNSWLGSDKLKTPYQLMVRSLVALDQLPGPLEQGLEEVQNDGLDIEPDYDREPEPTGAYPVIIDTEAWAGRLTEIIDESEADRISELVLVDQRTNTVVTHRDVGIGISQVLPVLVMAYGSEQKILAMEQPEIHLHPALQAELGDVFIESALGERQNTFILETHSEHLIHRLSRRIREGKINPDDIGVVYVEPLERGSRFVELRLDEDGDFIDKWPGGFFEESYHEKFAGR